MNLKTKLFAITATVLFIGGCASYNGGTRSNLSTDHSTGTVSASNHAVALRAKPVHEVEALKTQFGDDTLKYGILPVNLDVKNITSDTTLFFDPKDCSISTPSGNSNRPMTLDQVMSYTSKSYGRSVGWGIAFGIIGAAASAANVQHTNSKMRADYDAQMVKSANVASGQNVEGVAFFKVPEKLSSLEGWKVTVSMLDTSGKRFPVDVELTGTFAERESLQQDNQPAGAH